MAGLERGFAVIHGAAQPHPVFVRDRPHGGAHRVRQVDGGGAGSHEVAPHDLEELLGRTCEVHLQAR